MINLILKLMENEALKTAFLKLANMSISASWLVLAILVLRLVLKKAPKWVNVLLWGIVAVRLVCPFTIESALSLIPSTQTIPMNIEMAAIPAIDSGVEAVNSMVNPIIAASFTPNPAASANPLQIWIPLASVVWAFGMVLMLLYTAISYWRLNRRIDTAVLYRDNIFQSEHVSSPFVLGIIKPKIYLPFHMNEQDLQHVVAHEQAHIRRKDHWWKPLGFLLLTVHWFNPLMWLAYVLLCGDIEIACDEKVIKDLDNEQRADYTQALVACSVNRRVIAACPLAFGEVGVKDRVKSVMNYKKPTFWAITLALLVCAAVTVCFLTDPNPSREFSMTGNNVSNLNPEAIVDRIIDIENITNSGVYTNPNNYSLQVDSDFNWAGEDSQAVRYFFSDSKSTYSGQLRIFPDKEKYLILPPTEKKDQESTFLLRHYLDAVKYLPQDSIRQMAPADQYIIQQREEGQPSDYNRVITYSSKGVEDTDGWYIHLQIQPLHEEGGQYHGTGDEVLDVFYGDSYGAVATPDNIAFGRYDLEGENAEITEVRLRNLHNGKDTVITNPADIQSIAEFFTKVQGTNRTSSKGYYGGSYDVQLCNDSRTVLSIGFGDDDSFNCGDYGDGYPARYELWGVTREDVIRFFSQYDSSDFEWGLTSILNAKLLEIHDGYFLVEPVEGSLELSSASRIEVPMKNMEPSPEPKVGDILEIEYDGQLQETYPARINNPFSIKIAESIRRLSLNDVIILSQKGHDLNWSDFDRFEYIETGFGLYIRVYEINDMFRLLIGGNHPEGYPNKDPMYIYLTLVEDKEIKIDIRDGGVTEFISEHNSDSSEEWDRIPMVMVNGELYLDTGKESTVVARCGMMDGEITSQVDGSKAPTIDNQSNFGTGYGYQYGTIEGTIEIFMNEKWWIFATEEVRREIQFPQNSDGTSNKDILKIFSNSISGDNTIIVTDHVYADDSAYGLDGVVQYADETGSPWKLAFIRDGVVHLVGQNWGTDYIIASRLKYLGNGAVQVYVENKQNGDFYECIIIFAQDESGNTNFKSESKEVEVPKDTMELMTYPIVPVTVVDLITGEQKFVNSNPSIRAIQSLIASEWWAEGNPACDYDFKITVNEEDFLYHTDCGTFTAVSGDRCITLDETQQEAMDRLLSEANDVLDRYWLTIGADGVKSIEIKTAHSSGGCEHADGSLYQKGERIWVECLDGYRDLRGVSFTAVDEAGQVIWQASIPDGEDNEGFTHLRNDDWNITNIP